MGSCHGTFLATPARQGFSEATRDRTVGCPPRSPSLRGRRAEAPRRAGRAQRPSPGEGEAGPAARSPAAPGGGGSRRGAAPGLRPGEMRRGRAAGGGEGGRGRGRGAADRPCPAPSMSECLCISAAYARTFSSALRSALSSYLSARPFHECCHKETVASGMFPPWVLWGRKIDASFAGREKSSSNSFKTKSGMLVPGR